jgi:hypothetical protein
MDFRARHPIHARDELRGKIRLHAPGLLDGRALPVTFA